MFFVSNELINNELNDDMRIGFDFKHKKLTSKFINWIFNHYYIEELCENFYDSCPVFEDEELYHMYMDYIYGHEGHVYSKQDHTKQELKDAYYKIKNIYNDYESKRIKFNNWQEPYFKGNWGMSQKYVDSFGKKTLKEIRKFPKSIKNRFYYAEKDDVIRIYFYGRDFWKVDYWFIFRKRKKRLK